MIELLNIDCMKYMATCKDKAFDLAIVDPPFGIGQNWSKDRKSQFYKHRNNFNNSIPGKKYFQELFRVSRHQIIWGCNYYWNYLKPSNNLIFWDKGKDTFTQHGSAGELAWTSITRYPLVKVKLNWNGCVVCEKEEKIHPHQKPIKLYEWTLHHYAKGGGADSRYTPWERVLRHCCSPWWLFICWMRMRSGIFFSSTEKV